MSDRRLLLAIETSCDETAASVIAARPDGEEPAVLSNIVLSQDEIHAPYGGVVPELASRQHIRSIAPIVRESLAAAGVGLGEIDRFAVTQGPGLIGSLLVGVSFAKGLAYWLRKPLAGVDHVRAHIEAVALEQPRVEYPALALIVSGGHTSLFALPAPLRYDLVGRTRDDAAGEALDKIAKFLGLGYPGGPVIQRLGEGGAPGRFEFALPRMSDGSLDFSFSGLKTAALRIIRENKVARDSSNLPDFLASFESAIVRALLENLFRAVEALNPRTLVLCGGVASNKRLRTEFERRARRLGIAACVPSPKLCTDNAAMVGALAWARVAAGEEGDLALDLDAYPRQL